MKLKSYIVVFIAFSLTVIVGKFSFSGVSAVECALNGVTFSPSSVGLYENVDVTVAGAPGCKDFIVSINMYGVSLQVNPLNSPKEFLGTIKGKMNYTLGSSGATSSKVSYKFTPEDYNKISGVVSKGVLFEAIAGSSKVESDNILELDNSSGCQLSGVTFSPTSSKIGEEVTIRVLSSTTACQGWDLQIKIWEYDAADPNDFIKTLPTVKMTALPGGAQAVVKYKFTEEDYVAGGNETSADYEAMGFEAVAGTSKIQSWEWSSNLLVVEGLLRLYKEAVPENEDGDTGGGTTTTGKTYSYNFNIQNPLQAESLSELIDTIIGWLTAIAIPIAVIMILYGGLLFLTAGANPGNVDKGKKIVTYAVLGLAIIFIGKGFVDLIESILDLGEGA